MSLSGCEVCVCDEYEIIVDYNYKENRLFTLHLRESQILNCLVIGKLTKPVENTLYNIVGVISDLMFCTKDDSQTTLSA